MAATERKKCDRDNIVKKMKKDEFFIRQSYARCSNSEEGRKCCRAKLLGRFFLIMSSVWWCTSTSNCIPVVVSAQQLRCPSKCACYDEYKKIYCQSLSLRTFPSNLPDSTTTFLFTGNNIGSLNKTVFKTLTRLKTLNLKSNRIYDIPVTAFYGLDNLVKLDLSNNKLTKIPHAVDYLRSLQSLSLRNNPITSMRAFQFVLMRNTLKSLDLGQLRHLTLLSPAVFGRLTKLETLTMDACNLVEIPNLSPLLQLQNLDLSTNRFSVLRSNTFRGLNQLINLSLESSQIMAIEDGAFAQLYKLQSLNLMRNNLSTLGASTFENNFNLKHLYLTHNRWICNCNLMPLAGYLNDNELCASDQCPVCESPAIYKGDLVAMLLQDDSPPCAALIMKPPEQTSLNVSVGGQTKIPCPTVGPGEEENQVTDVRWQLPNGTILTHGRYKARVKKLDNGSLNITNAVLKDQGIYTCMATLSSKKVVNGSVLLNVSTKKQSYSSSFLVTTMTTSRIPQRTQKKSITIKPTPTSITLTKDLSLTSQRQKVPPTVLTLTDPVNLSPPKISKPGASTSKPVDRINPNQILGTSNIIIGCFASLTVLAAILLIIFYKIRRKNYNSRSGNNTDSSDEVNKNVSNDHIKEVSTARPNSKDEYNLTTPDHLPRNRSAMTESVTRTWVETLPEHAETVRLPSSAVRVLPPTLEECRVTREQPGFNRMERSNKKMRAEPVHKSASNQGLPDRNLSGQEHVENCDNVQKKVFPSKPGHSLPVKMTVKRCKEKSLHKHRDNRYSAGEITNKRRETNARPQSCVDSTHTNHTEATKNTKKHICTDRHTDTILLKSKKTDCSAQKSLEGLLNHKETEI